jgi:hypothetical protein
LKQQAIYEIAIIPIGSLTSLRPKEAVFTYFSNLKKCIDSLLTSLAINNWENKINYTLVYRSIKEKGKFVAEFAFAGQKIFKVVVTVRTINPSLSMLGIDEKPIVKKK